MPIRIIARNETDEHIMKLLRGYHGAWSIRTIQAYLKKFYNFERSESTIRRRLYRLVEIGQVKTVRNSSRDVVFWAAGYEAPKKENLDSMLRGPYSMNKSPRIF